MATNELPANAYALLDARAQSVADDIEGDNPQLSEEDTGYDLWVERMPDGVIRGVIDMGDLYSDCFVFDENTKEWEQDSSWDPFMLSETIIQLRKWTGF